MQGRVVQYGVYPSRCGILIGFRNYTEIFIEHPGIVGQDIESCSEQSGVVGRGIYR